MKRLKNLAILVVGILILYLLLFVVKWNCPVREFLNVECPACGLTRGFRAIFSLNLLEALWMNILAIPLFITVLLFIIMLFYGIITNKDLMYQKTIGFFNKYYKQVLLLVLISFVWNNLK